MSKHGDESSGRFKMRQKTEISWIENSIDRLPIYIRRVWGQNPAIGEGSEIIGRSLNLSDSKYEEKLEITLNKK